MYFEGMALSKLTFPEENAQPFRSFARATGYGPYDTTCDVDTACGPSAIGRSVTFVKTQPGTAVQVSFVDTMRSYGGGGSRACRWLIRFNGAACPSGEIFGTVYSAGDDPHRMRSVRGYCRNLSPGTYTVQVHVQNAPGYGAKCNTGWDSPSWTLEAEEIQ